MQDGKAGEGTGAIMVDESAEMPGCAAPAAGATRARNAVKRVTSERLIDVALGAWESTGHAGISARLIAQAAGQPVSGIYYHFTDLERLLLTSQARAQDAARIWCLDQLELVPTGMAPAPAAMAPLLAALVHDWSTGHRRLAFAWRECQLAAQRDPAYLPALCEWRTLWAWFWQEVCARCGVPDLAELTALMFDGESFLHLMRWNATLDLACLHETCEGWGRWLGRQRAPEGPWRRHARLSSLETMAALPSLEGTTRQIAEAAADLVTRQGPASLTHRAVAAEAGLTLGVVSYNFRTSADLMRLAFETIYRRLMGDGSEPWHNGPVESYDHFIEAALAYEDARDMTMSRVAMHELLLAAARDDGYRPFMPQLRYLRGRTSQWQLVALVGKDKADSPLEAAMLSAIAFGTGRAAIGLDRERQRALWRRVMEQIQRLLLATR